MSIRGSLFADKAWLSLNEQQVSLASPAQLFGQGKPRLALFGLTARRCL
jgi:hypothetical protein